MKKVFVGGYASCAVHNEKDMIVNCLSASNLEITNDYEVADLIVVLDTCLGNYKNLQNSIEYIDIIINNKKQNVPVLVSGCLEKGVNFELTEEQKKVLSKVTLVPSNQIIEYVLKMVHSNLLDEELLEDIKLPYTVRDYEIKVSPVEGCLNHCSFCKSNYMNFTLKSNPFEQIEKLAHDIKTMEYPLHYVKMFSSNLSLYGMDLYKEQRAHDVIRTLTSPDNIQFAYVGALINWYPELINEIITNPKVKMIFTSIESGSPRIYELMNRPISLERLIQIIKIIKKERPDIVIGTELIVGYPTETIEDVKKSIELLEELDICPLFLHPYENSIQIPSSKLEQHSKEHCNEMTYYAFSKLQPLQDKYKEKVYNGEMFVAHIYEKEQVYGVMLVSGRNRLVRFDQLDRDYQIGEMIEANKVKPKQLVKRKKI